MRPSDGGGRAEEGSDADARLQAGGEAEVEVEVREGVLDGVWAMVDILSDTAQ